jgi:hypothetical protein
MMITADQRLDIRLAPYSVQFISKEPDQQVKQNGQCDPESGPQQCFTEGKDMASFINNPEIQGEHQDDEKEKTREDNYFMCSCQHFLRLYRL